MGARLGSSWISARVKLLPSRLLIQAARSSSTCRDGNAASDSLMVDATRCNSRQHRREAPGQGVEPHRDSYEPGGGPCMNSHEHFLTEFLARPVIENPYPLYTELQEHGPLAYVATHDIWLVSGYRG